MTDAAGHIKDLTFRNKKVEHDNGDFSDALELLKELLIDYRATLMTWTKPIRPDATGIDIFKYPEDRYAVNESIKLLKKNNIDIGE
jgi:hypothetical protein